MSGHMKNAAAFVGGIMTQIQNGEFELKGFSIEEVEADEEEEEDEDKPRRPKRFRYSFTIVERVPVNGKTAAE